MTNASTYKQTLFLSWINDFLTLERFAEYYDLDTEQARAVISEGRAIHEAWAAAN